jgi:hypothetical protein
MEKSFESLRGACWKAIMNHKIIPSKEIREQLDAEQGYARETDNAFRDAGSYHRNAGHGGKVPRAPRFRGLTR